MAQGRSKRPIAARLSVTDKAIEKGINNIFGKLDLPMDDDENGRAPADLRFSRNTATQSP